MVFEAVQTNPNHYFDSVEARKKNPTLGILSIVGLATLATFFLPSNADAAPVIPALEQSTNPSCSTSEAIVYDDIHAATKGINECAAQGLNTLRYVQLVGGKVSVTFYILDHNKPITPTQEPTPLPPIRPIPSATPTPTATPKYMQPLPPVPYPPGVTEDYFKGQPQIGGFWCGPLTTAAIYYARFIGEEIEIPKRCIKGY